MLFMALLPFTKRFKCQKLAGSVVYSGGGGHQNLLASAVDEALKKRIGQVLDVLGGDEPPLRSPSLADCRFCSIAGSDCRDHVTEEPELEPRHAGILFWK
jgi:hypothetical protein